MSLKFFISLSFPEYPNPLNGLSFVFTFTAWNAASFHFGGDLVATREIFNASCKTYKAVRRCYRTQ